MIETIYIARHGFRQNWINDLWKSPTDTPRDPPLAAYGEKQARELANYIASLPDNEKPTAIFSSPFYRCIQTAAPIAASLSLHGSSSSSSSSTPTLTPTPTPIYIENGLSEWFSPVVPGTGLHPKPPAAPTLSSLFPSFNIDPETDWSPVCIPSRLGETVSQLHERCREFLTAFIRRIEERDSESMPGAAAGAAKHTSTTTTHSHPHLHRRVLLMTHAATAIALTRALAQDDNLSMRVACCSLTVLKRRKTATDPLGSWDISELTRGDFLEGGLERDWGFEDVVLNGNEVIFDEGVPGTENEVEDTSSSFQIIPFSKI